MQKKLVFGHRSSYCEKKNPVCSGKKSKLMNNNVFVVLEASDLN